jgi:hypothetical protein
MGQKAIKQRRRAARVKKKDVQSSKEAETTIEQHLDVEVATTSSAMVVVQESNEASGSGEGVRPTGGQKSHLGVDIHDAGSRVTRSHTTRASSVSLTCNGPSANVSQLPKAPTKNRRTQSLPPQVPRQVRKASKAVTTLLDHIKLSNVSEESDEEYIDVDNDEYEEEPEDSELDKEVSDDGYEISGRKTNGYWVLTDDEDPVDSAAVAPSQVDGTSLNSNVMLCLSNNHYISPKDIR